VSDIRRWHRGSRAATLSANQIEKEFDRTAHRYDAMVSRNPGYHDHLRAAARLIADSVPREGRITVLDVGCGSGASTRALLDAFPDARGHLSEVVGVDASAGMIAQARMKQWPAGVRFVHAPVEDIVGLDAVARPAHGVFACYLFRNVSDRDAAIADVYRVLAPGGTLVVQDYSVAGSVRAVLLWSLVCWSIVIPLSLALTGRARLYRYLWRSVLRFDSVPRFEQRLRAAGFAPTTAATVHGWQRGILHTFVAHKPPEFAP
jgi:ubiquinone/menaquinone biosynthesis C-methylase UbiE